MKKTLRRTLPFLILMAALAIFGMMVANRAEPPKVEPHKHVPSVRAITVQPADIAIKLPSQGMIESRQVTTLASEVAGRVIRVSPKFNTGELFEEGEILLELEPADYEAALRQAEASLADARLAEATEKARAEQAVRDWGKLAGKEKPGDLAVRKPHLESAASRVKAAEAAVVKATRDVERTAIKAPFRGKLRAKFTELGSVLAPGARVAELYSADALELRLPLSLDDYSFLDADTTKAGVRLHTSIGGKEHAWQAKVSRLEGDVDRGSRSVYLVAEVVDTKADDTLMKPGLFVRAEVGGTTLKNVTRVPRAAFLDEKRVLVVHPDNTIHSRELRVVRGEGAHQIVSGGLEQGDRVVVSTLASPVEGMAVEVVPAAPTQVAEGKTP